MRHLRATKNACFLVFFLSCTVFPNISNIEGISLQLRINKNYEQKVVVAWIEFGSEVLSPDVGGPKNIRLGRAPGGTLVGLRPVADQPRSYRITVDSNGDGNLDNDAAQVIQPDANVQVSVSRKWANKEDLLP